MSDVQHRGALAKANETRLARAEVRRKVCAGEMTLAQALAEPCCQTTGVYQLLSWQHGWGRKRILGVLRRLGVSEMRHVGLLTGRQRDALVQACGEGGCP